MPVPNHIGRGIAFPITFADSTGNDQLLDLTETDDEVIGQSIYIILSTRIGECYNNVNFGSNIDEILFEPNDVLSRDLLYIGISEALSRWEPRITVTNIRFLGRPNATMGGGLIDSSLDHVVQIQIDYIKKSTHTAGSYVFPFTRGGASMTELSRPANASPYITRT